MEEMESKNNPIGTKNKGRIIGPTKKADPVKKVARLGLCLSPPKVKRKSAAGGTAKKEICKSKVTLIKHAKEKGHTPTKRRRMRRLELSKAEELRNEVGKFLNSGPTASVVLMYNGKETLDELFSGIFTYPKADDERFIQTCQSLQKTGIEIANTPLDFSIVNNGTVDKTEKLYLKLRQDLEDAGAFSENEENQQKIMDATRITSTDELLNVLLADSSEAEMKDLTPAKVSPCFEERSNSSEPMDSCNQANIPSETPDKVQVVNESVKDSFDLPIPVDTVNSVNQQIPNTVTESPMHSELTSRVSESLGGTPPTTRLHELNHPFPSFEEEKSDADANNSISSDEVMFVTEILNSSSRPTAIDSPSKENESSNFNIANTSSVSSNPNIIVKNEVKEEGSFDNDNIDNVGIRVDTAPTALDSVSQNVGETGEFINPGFEDILVLDSPPIAVGDIEPADLDSVLIFDLVNAKVDLTDSNQLHNYLMQAQASSAIKLSRNEPSVGNLDGNQSDVESYYSAETTLSGSENEERLNIKVDMLEGHRNSDRANSMHSGIQDSHESDVELQSLVPPPPPTIIMSPEHSVLMDTLHDPNLPANAPSNQVVDQSQYDLPAHNQSPSWATQNQTALAVDVDEILRLKFGCRTVYIKLQRLPKIYLNGEDVHPEASLSELVESRPEAPNAQNSCSSSSSVVPFQPTEIVGEIISEEPPSSSSPTLQTLSKPEPISPSKRGRGRPQRSHGARGCARNNGISKEAIKVSKTDEESRCVTVKPPSPMTKVQAEVIASEPSEAEIPDAAVTLVTEAETFHHTTALVQEINDGQTLTETTTSVISMGVRSRSSQRRGTKGLISTTTKSNPESKRVNTKPCTRAGPKSKKVKVSTDMDTNVETGPKPSTSRSCLKDNIILGVAEAPETQNSCSSTSSDDSYVALESNPAEIPLTDASSSTDEDYITLPPFPSPKTAKRIPAKNKAVVPRPRAKRGRKPILGKVTKIILKMKELMFEDTPNISELCQLMAQTLDSRKAYFAKVSWEVESGIKEFPALKLYPVVKAEFSLLEGPAQRMERMMFLELKLEEALRNASRHKKKQPGQIRHRIWENALEQAKTAGLSPQKQKVLGMICLSFLMVENAAAVKLFRLRKKKEKVFLAGISTPTLDIVESTIFDVDTEIWIYADGIKSVQVPNFYEGVLTIYAMHYVFDIAYNDELAELFHYFDKVCLITD